MTAELAVRRREVVTPEGVPIQFAVAPAGDRVAALVEGIFRQLVHSVPVRYGVAVGFALLWAAWLLPGRSQR